MAAMFLVTYEIITPESAEHGDAAERGYIGAGEWRHELSTVDSARDMPALRMDLRTALNHVHMLEDAGAFHPGVWFSPAGSSYGENLRTGAEEFRSLHPARNITAASFERLRRLLRKERRLI